MNHNTTKPMKTMMKNMIIELQCVYTEGENDVWKKDYLLNGKKLHPAFSLQVYNHSPDGFNHGYGGSGPTQLALAICLEVFGPAGECFYKEFKSKHVAGFGHDEENSPHSDAQHRTWTVLVDMSPWAEKVKNKSKVIEFPADMSYKYRVALIEQHEMQPGRFASRIWLHLPGNKLWEWNHQNRRKLAIAEKVTFVFW